MYLASLDVKPFLLKNHGSDFTTTNAAILKQVHPILEKADAAELLPDGVAEFLLHVADTLDS